MALNLNQQVIEFIKKSKRILITFKKDYSLDGLASAIALFLILKKINKVADIVSDGFSLPDIFSFLPKAEIKSNIGGLQNLVISLDLSRGSVDQLSYGVEKSKLNIYITPKDGAFSPANVKTAFSEFKYDLIIVLDSPDLESLGKTYTNYKDFLYKTPIINIDHGPSNEQFGQINYTNVTAVASAEIIFELIQQFETGLMDKEIATCLLAGMISKTKSFKSVNVTPRALSVASALMAAEADREAIVRNLYQTRSLATLKLWGRVLARLKNDFDKKIAWSIINENDFIEAGANEDNLNGIIDELISAVPGIEIVVLLFQQKNNVKIMIESLKNFSALYLIKQFNPQGNKGSAQGMLIDSSLIEAEKQVIEAIKDNIAKLPA